MTISASSPPHLTIQVADGTLGELGYVVIDRPVHGTASGGVRCATDVSPDELASLARAMTYKWAFLNVPMGGAKAGISADPRRLGCERQTVMEAFGRSIASLVNQRVYYPGIDLGTTLDDLRAIMRGAGQPLPEQQIDGSYCTALTVFETIRQVIRFNGRSLAGLRVAIEGFGKVAGTVAMLLAQEGAKLVAVSTIEGAIANSEGLDTSLLLAMRQKHGDQLIQHYLDAKPILPGELFTQQVDLLVPGARPRVIHTGNADQVQAKFIIPISNAPLTADAEQSLIARQVVVVPDFVANCGGILASDMLSHRFDLEDSRYLVETTFATVVTRLLERAQREGQPVSDVARTIAWQNHQAFHQPSPTTRVARLRRVLGRDGLNGLWQRVAWRAHYRWPGLSRAIRLGAIRRFAELTLGATIDQATWS